MNIRQGNDSYSAIHRDPQNFFTTSPFSTLDDPLLQRSQLEVNFLSGPSLRQKRHSLIVKSQSISAPVAKSLDPTHVFPADPPAWFFLLELFRFLTPVLSESHDYIALDCSQRTYAWCSSFAGHRSYSLVEGGAGGRRTIIRQLAVIQVTLEEHEARMGKV